MGASSTFAGGLVSLLGGGVGGLVAAAIAGAIGDDVCRRLVASGREAIARIDDPVALPTNHVLLKGLRRARLQALGTMADETRRDLSLDENGSPFLRAVRLYVRRSIDEDPDAVLDPRALIAREVERPPTGDGLHQSVRGLLDFKRAVAGLFRQDSEAPDPQALFTEADRVALTDIELLFQSQASLDAAQARDEAWAGNAPNERAALLESLKALALAELIEALDLTDINWSAPAPEAFLARFEGTNRGFTDTYLNLVQRNEEPDFRAMLDTRLGAETRVAVGTMAEEQRRQRDDVSDIKSMVAQLLAQKAEVADDTGISPDQVEGLLEEIEDSGLPADQFRAALYGGAKELKELGNSLRQRSNLLDPALEPLRQKASEAVDAGHLDAARAALEELSAEELARAEAPLRAAAEAQSRLGQLERSASRYLAAADHYAKAAQMLQPIDPYEAAVQRFYEGFVCGAYSSLSPLPGAYYRALRAYDAALEVCTRIAPPSLWAATQVNKSLVLQDLGSRAGGSEGQALLEQAVAAYDVSLEVATRETVPFEWASTQMNKANALALLGMQAGGLEGQARLEEAVEVYDASLEVRTRETVPVQWAVTQMNKANALQELGERAGGSEGKALLKQAVAAYDASLEVLTRETAASNWAATQENKAGALLALFELFETSRKSNLLQDAEACVLGALEVYGDAMPYNRDRATKLLARIRAAIAALEP